MLSTEVRAPWWHWALLSLCTTVLVTAVTLAGLIILAFRGIDVLDYVYLARPPFLTDGMAAAVLAALIATQAAGPLLVLLLYRPSRAMVMAGLGPPGSLRGSLLRLAVGVIGSAVLQVVWTRVGPVPAEPWRVTEHLMYAVVRGGAFWPMAWLVLALGLIVPLAEEVLFRGVMFGFIRRRWGLWAGALGSAILFGAAHGPANALPTALLGLYMAYQVDRDRSLAGAMALHVLNNVGALLVIALAL